MGSWTELHSQQTLCSCIEPGSITGKSLLGFICIRKPTEIQPYFKTLCAFPIIHQIRNGLAASASHVALSVATGYLQDTQGRVPLEYGEG